jgi:hypothetical protein
MSLLECRGVEDVKIIISAHDPSSEVLQLLKSTNFKDIERNIISGITFSSVKQAINKNLYMGLKKAFADSNCKLCIVLEDDILLSVDALEFFKGIFSIHENKRSFRAINGFSKMLDGKDDEYVRLNYGVGWGWALSKKTYEKLLQFWNGDEDQHWDYVIEPYVRTGYVINPMRSRVRNIGFDETATHTANLKELGELMDKSFYSSNFEKVSKWIEIESKFTWREDCYNLSVMKKSFITLNYIFGHLYYFIYRVQLFSFKSGHFLLQLARKMQIFMNAKRI